jgi:hypothetical protein
MVKRWKLWAGVGAALALVATGAILLANWAKDTQEPMPEGQLPGDFEPAGAVVLACHELVEGQQVKLLTEILQAAAGKTPVVLLANRANEELAVRNILAQLEVDAAGLRFLRAAHDSSRIGHYGPLWIARPGDRPALIDAPRHLVEPRGGKDLVLDVARGLDFPIVRLAVYLSRGNLISNGRGVAITTTAILDQNADLGWDEEAIRRALREGLGITQLVILRTLEGEPTGHAEWFAAFTAPDTVVVGQDDPKREPDNAAILDQTAETLGQVEVEPGKLLKVERLPMPPRRPGVWRSYTPVAFLNGMLLAPVYGGIDAAGQKQALETYARLLPHHKIVPIDVATLEAAAVTLRALVLPIGGVSRELVSR